MIVKKAKRIDVECVARGYLAGSAWTEYKESGTVCGYSLPKGLKESQQLPKPLFTPTNKAESGHDEPITLDEMKKLEYKTDMVPPEQGPLPLAHGGDAGFTDKNIAGFGFVDAADQVEQRALAAAAFADQSDKFAVPESGADPVDDRPRMPAFTEGFGDIFQPYGSVSPVLNFFRAVVLFLSRGCHI